jgi:hypothetical protein
MPTKPGMDRGGRGTVSDGIKRRFIARRKLGQSEASKEATMNDVAWLSRLLGVCRSALARAENPESPEDAVFIEDLRRYTRQVEERLKAARRSAERS